MAAHDVPRLALHVRADRGREREMRGRVLVAGVTMLLAGVLPLQRSVVHALAANVTCATTASGEAESPGFSSSVAEVYATEEIEGTVECESPAPFMGTLTVWAEYDIATLTWTPTDCPAASGTFVGAPVGGVWVAFAVVSTACVYAPGDPSLNTLHRAHAQATVGGTTVADTTSSPWFMAGVSG